MANTLRGLVKDVSPVKTMNTKSGQPFNVREIVLDCTRHDPYTGERGFENTPIIRFTQDKCPLLDNVQPGMVVEVSIDITGRYYPDKNAYYNDVRGYKIEILRAAQQPQQNAPQAYPQPMPQPQAQPVQQPYAPPMGQYAAPQPAPQYPQQQYNTGVPDPNTGLPF